VRSLGAKPAGTLAEFVKLATVKETPGRLPRAEGMVADLLKDHEQVIRNLRKDVDASAGRFHDAGTGDFLTGLMEEHEKMAWMLRSYLGQ
jgi:starvation-inducible DNA-binding protein